MSTAVRDITQGALANNNTASANPVAPARADRASRHQDVTMDVGANYTLVKKVGSGAYGVVWSAHDVRAANQNPRGNRAIKKITNAFDHTTDTKRLLREILLLNHLRHPNIIAIRDLMSPKDKNGRWTSLYIITDLMDTDLHRIIQSPQPLTDQHMQYFIYQVLRALKYLHSVGVLHRDVKPSNLLLNENCELKLCDFGLARCLPDRDDSDDDAAPADDQQPMTEYVVTRWYRAPELLLQEKNYGVAVDVWSVGCVLGELLGRRPLFPGTDYIDEIVCITNTLGTPRPEDIAHIGSEQARQFVCALAEKLPVPLAKVFPRATPQCLEFLSHMLQWDPRNRISVDDALAHPYLSELHDPNDEPVASHKFKCAHDGKQLTKYQMKEMIFEQVLLFHPDLEPQLEEIKAQHEAMAVISKGK
eukprot:TRINITY_DN10737_c0_g1_i1.p1 TRINITY_DN10737_c0_g1~~TRINITY_DN10737_c0_g1_i1.p1  ORF type:complete len:418 (+),score=74.45 TRINITY_DN10737_c0_g1_i1:138-1391(+)